MRSTAAVSPSKVYLPTIVSGRVIWHLGYTTEASAAAFTQSYGEFQHAALQQEPSYRVKGVLTDGFDSTTKQYADAVSRGAPGQLSAPRAQQAPDETDRRSRPRCARRYARSSTPCCTGRASARACGCLRSASDYATLPTTSPPRLGTANGAARAALVPGEEGGLVCGACRPADAGDQHPARSGP